VTAVYTVRPVGIVSSARTTPVDDQWGPVDATITLLPPYGVDSVAGLAEFSHLDVVYLFHLVDPARPVPHARHPRGNAEWPLVGIFAQRAKDRPNRLGVSTCELVAVEGDRLFVRGLDAIDGTPVLDIKPHLVEFGPRGPVHQPQWSHELMQHYY
jgi:tRNA (adenine37-N6)-methyltransferase